MRERMSQGMASKKIEDNLVLACYYVQQKTPIPIDDEFRYSTFVEIQTELQNEAKREEKQSRKKGLGRR